MSRITANGIDFAYLEAGPADGPLALCLHGFPDHAPTWEPMLGALGDAGFHAVAPWLRGYHPTSPAPDGNYEAAALATDACALADALAGDGDAFLVGHDWGALTAYLATVHRPERFQRVVTMAVPHPAAFMSRFLVRPDQLKRSWYMFFFQSPLAEMAVAADDYAFIDMLWRDWSPGFVAPDDFMRALKDTFAAGDSLSAALGYYRAMLSPPEEPDPALAEVRALIGSPVPVPLLYFQGDDDGCITEDLVAPDEIRPFCPGGFEYELVEGAGHFLHLERPDVVNKATVEFLTA
jgi:pimeloyl-ACP methyl ester carboxylesterase